jgi:hypothetical protein
MAPQNEIDLSRSGWENPDHHQPVAARPMRWELEKPPAPEVEAGEALELERDPWSVLAEVARLADGFLSSDAVTLMGAIDVLTKIKELADDA